MMIYGMCLGSELIFKVVKDINIMIMFDMMEFVIDCFV